MERTAFTKAPDFVLRAAKDGGFEADILVVSVHEQSASWDPPRERGAGPSSSDPRTEYL